MIRTDTELKKTALNLLISGLGEVDAECFDSTEWRRDHLPEEKNVHALSRKASEYAATLKRQ